MEKLTKGQRRKAEILNIARTLLVEDGYDAFVLRTIAAKADMKLGNLQFYFATKELLLEEVIKIEAQRELATVATALESESKPERKLQQFCHCMIKTWRGSSGRIFTLMLFFTYQNANIRALNHDIYHNFYEFLIPIISALDPGKRKPTYLQRAQLITALIDGAPQQLVATGQQNSFLKNGTIHEAFTSLLFVVFYSSWL